MDNQFLENKNENDNFDKIELLYNKNKYVSMLLELYKKYLNKNNLEQNNKNKNQVIHQDNFLKNNNIKITNDDNKKHLNQLIPDLIINKIDEYLYMNPICITDYNILNFINYKLYNSSEFIKIINENKKFKKLIKYLVMNYIKIFLKILNIILRMMKYLNNII